MRPEVAVPALDVLLSFPTCLMALDVFRSTLREGHRLCIIGVVCAVLRGPLASRGSAPALRLSRARYGQNTGRDDLSFQ